MPNHVTDVRVRRISFVDRAATRDPENPTEPRRALLFKSEDATPVELEKRRIGKKGAAPAPEPASAPRDVEASDFRLSSALAEVEAGERRMLADPNHSPAQLQKHKKVKAELETELFHLHHPQQAAARDETLRKAEAEKPAGLSSALNKAEALQKYDPELSSAEAFRQAMLDPAVQDEYYRESRTLPPPAPRQLSKAEQDRESVERAADYLVKSEGLRPAEAYARALRESGVYSRAAA